MIDFSNRMDDGKYKVVESVMVDIDGKCGTEVRQYNFCGHCGTMLEKPKDPEREWEEFKKAMCGLH